MAKQSAGRPIPSVPSGRKPAKPGRPAPTLGGKPVSPAVARARGGAPAAQGHGGGGGK
jgi:hypothetical protein